MKQLTVAFLYNVRHNFDPKSEESHLQVDFDEWHTVRWIIRHLKNCGYKVIPIEADQDACLKLSRNRRRIDLAFNYAEGLYGEDRECHIPAMLEALRIPYLGSPPLTAALALNKAKAKEVLLANGIPTLPFQVFDSVRTKRMKELHYPLIVKPVSQGSSAGITDSSVVESDADLRRQVARVLDLFKQPAMAEPFLTGREFSIPMIGNPPQVLPIIEPVHNLLPRHLKPIDSFEVKWIYEEESDTNHLRCPARLDARLKAQVKAICLAAWEVLGIRDWCRMDVRCDKRGQPFFLEVNIPAGLIPPEESMTSYMPLSARAAGLQYEDLLKLLVETALHRYVKCAH